MTPLPKLSTPARKALTSVGITSLEDVVKFTRAEILGLHGIGRTTITPLESALASAKMSFKS